jgi:hypothetical protein
MQISKMDGSGLAPSAARIQPVLTEYMYNLSEYKRLQSVLKPWTMAFEEQHKRLPSQADVEATGKGSNPAILELAI